MSLQKKVNQAKRKNKKSRNKQLQSTTRNLAANIIRGVAQKSALNVKNGFPVDYAMMMRNITMRWTQRRIIKLIGRLSKK